MNLVNKVVVSGKSISKTRYLTMVNRGCCRGSTGNDRPFTSKKRSWAHYVHHALYGTTQFARRDFGLQGVLPLIAAVISIKQVS